VENGRSEDSVSEVPSLTRCKNAELESPLMVLEGYYLGINEGIDGGRERIGERVNLGSVRLCCYLSWERQQ
jgi:hypothetical protein